MMIKPGLALFAVGAACIPVLFFHGQQETSVAVDPSDLVMGPLPSKDRQKRLETAVIGFFSARDADERRAFVRRRAFVDANLGRSFGEPLEVDEVGELNNGGTTLTMVRARFAEGYVSLLLEELVSGRFVVDSETANPEESDAWPNFRQTRATAPQAFRVYGTLSDYYNFEFDQRTHIALEIAVPGSEDLVTGYVSRASTDSMRLLEAVQGQISVPLILSLRHPESLNDPSQVIIDRLVQGDWVILDDAVAPTFGEREIVSG